MVFGASSARSVRRLGGVFWRRQRWVLGFQFSQQTQSASNFGNCSVDAARFDLSTIYLYTFTFLGKLGSDRRPAREGAGTSEAEAKETR
jgi:hypothetical protein